jgi:HlyD family secretion protein
MEEDGHAYVWLANESNLIEKHEVTLGEYDEDLSKYEILDGLTQDDYIAYPLETISEGNPVIYNDYTSSADDLGDLSDAFSDGSYSDVYDEFDDVDFEYDDDDSDDFEFDDEDYDDEDYDYDEDDDEDYEDYDEDDEDVRG